MGVEVTITDEMLQMAKNFAIKKQPTSYPRFGENAQQQIERLTAGKIGEQVGQEALLRLDIPHVCPDKFKVVQEMSYGDVADCIIFPDTEKEKKVDFKCAWKSFHIRILVPQNMFISQYKDIYVGIKIDIGVRKADVFGYATRQELETKHSVQDFGEGPAYWVYLKEMHDLDNLKNT